MPPSPSTGSFGRLGLVRNPWRKFWRSEPDRSEIYPTRADYSALLSWNVTENGGDAAAGNPSMAEFRNFLNTLRKANGGTAP